MWWTPPFAGDQELIDVRGRPRPRIIGSRIALLMAAHAHAAAARPTHIAGGERHVHERAVGTVVVVSPDQALLVREHGSAARSARLRLCDPLSRLANLIRCQAGDPRGFFEARFVCSECFVEILGRCRDERLVGPALVRDVGEPGVEQSKIGS